MIETNSTSALTNISTKGAEGLAARLAEALGEPVSISAVPKQSVEPVRDRSLTLSERVNALSASLQAQRSLSSEGRAQFSALMAEIDARNVSATSDQEAALSAGFDALEQLTDLIDQRSAIEPGEYRALLDKASVALNRAAVVVVDLAPENSAASEVFKVSATVLAEAIVDNDFTFKVEPSSPKAVADFHRIANQAGINALAKYDGIPESVVDEVRSALAADTARFESDEFSAREAILTPKALKRMMGTALANSLLKKVKSPKALKSTIKEFISIRKFKSAGRSGKPFPKNLNGVHKEKAIAAFAKGRLQAAGVKGPSVEKLFKAIHREYAQVLNHKAWPTISRDNIQIAQAGSRQYAAVSLTPAANLSAQLKHSYGELGGISSMSNTEGNHAVNLWKSDFSIEGSDFAVTAYRHGVHDAYKIHDAQLREKAADNRVAEAVIAMASGSPERLKRLDDGSYQLDIVSVNLQTAGKMAGEKDMISNQLSAYERAAGRTVTVQTQGRNGLPHEIQVKPNFVPLSVGVNQLATSSLSAFNGWHEVESINSSSLKVLVGDPSNTDLGGYAKQAHDRALADGNPKKARLIDDLSRQIKTIVNAPDDAVISQKNGKSDPYKLATRIVALANEIELVPAFNCKSGKDRTGQLDVEVKDFYRHLAQTDGAVRPLEYDRSLTEKQAFRNILEHGGSREIQVLNTGVPGTKSQTHATYEALGIPKGSFDTLKGLSSYVGS